MIAVIPNLHADTGRTSYHFLAGLSEDGLRWNVVTDVSKALSLTQSELDAVRADIEAGILPPELYLTDEDEAPAYTDDANNFYLQCEQKWREHDYAGFARLLSELTASEVA